MRKLLNIILKQKKYIYYGAGALVLIVAGIFIFGNNKTDDQTLVVKHGDFINQVSISGKVVASEAVDLGFKNGGRITGVFYSVDKGESGGPLVKAGTPIAKIDAKEAEQDVHEAEISLASAKLSLEKLKLENSEENLNADLRKAYDSGFTTVSDAFLDLSVIVTGLEDILAEDKLSENAARTKGNITLTYRIEAEKLYYEAQDAFKENRAHFRLLDRNSSSGEIERIIDETYETAKIFSNAVKSTKNLVDHMALDARDDPDFTSLKDTLGEYADTMNSHVNSLLSIQTSIKDYKDAFPSADLDIQDLELTVRQKEVALADAKNKLSDYYIRAPFTGIITNIDAKVGEIAGADTPLVSMMSADMFQIESYVPEVNIALITLGAEANVTLDAYGEDVFFKAKVVSIDPAETIRDGVSTYKIRLQFSGEDKRIKSGMTANVGIVIFDKPDVIALPGGVVFEKEGRKFVQVKAGKEILEKEVVLGAVSSLGQVEVVSGLADGDMVILNPQKE